MQNNSIISDNFKNITSEIVQEVVKRNKELPKSEIVKITTMAGCSAVNK
jgi:ATP-binding protein involved in chromosome partitioning